MIEIYLLIISIYYGSEWINRIKIFPIRLLGLQMAYPVDDVLSYVSYYPNIDR